MSNFKTIEHKLEAFISRFYTNELIKGSILFFSIGFLYFLLILFIESVLWLNPTARTILFCFFILVELLLFVRFILSPLAKLFKVQKGIDYQDASQIIGTHFPEVNDKLLNILQLNQSQTKSELLLASIEQKSIELKPIPFKLAINLKKNISYLKYAAIPVLLFVIIAVSGNFNWFSSSFERVKNYQTAYEQPAPFQFFVVNSNLNAIENIDFTLIVKTAGEVIPDNVQIQYNGDTYFLQEKGLGEFEYVFSQPKSNIQFELSANAVVSKPYNLVVSAVPSFLNFEMILDYPNYTKRKSEVISGSGNALVPAGTRIEWQVKTKSTNTVKIHAYDTLVFNPVTTDFFKAQKQVFKPFDYTVTTSNINLKDYESLAFKIDVVKDEYPELNLTMKVDSLDLQTLHFHGQLSDDYGITKLQLVYYPSNNPNNKNIQPISITNSTNSQFFSSFPNTLNITPGIAYDLYFQVFDNDHINNFKHVNSSVFSYRKRTIAEEKNKQLNEQNETIQDLNESFKKFDLQDKKLDEISQTQKEKSDLNFNDKKKLESFFKRQKQQDNLMKNFNKKLKDNLEKFENENDKTHAFKEDLKQRLKDNEEQLKKDEKLLEELEKLTDKINKDELGKKLDDLAKQNKNKQRSLKQLLELTKRFYVEKKLEKLKDDLLKLANEQEKLSNANDDENTKERQDALNQKFDDYKKEIEALEKDSKSLKKPIEIPRDKLDEQQIDKDQKEASDYLDKKESSTSDQEKRNSQSNAKKKQKQAAQKMQEMSHKMSASMSASSGDQIQEDVEMLRQILDNLVLFSFDQEALMNQFISIEANHNNYAKYLRKQQNLKEHFQHIDDSLFSLSLRQPKLSESVNKEISDVYFNMDNAIDLFSDNKLFQAISKQQFAITAANNLANDLSNLLDNMQESLSMSPGQGEGEQQLPDIIMSQDQLNKMMEQGLKKGDKGKPKEGEGKQDGKNSKDGDKGKEGNSKGSPKGKSGESGKSENGGKEGEQGDGIGEQNSGKLYKIYQKQQALRQALQERLEKEGLGTTGRSLVKQMEAVESDLLNKGFTNQTLQKMLDLKHQLLKLENATFQQGEDTKRESETNNKIFNSNINAPLPSAKQYFKTNEILDRQALPLQPIYKKKVQTYFKQIND